MREKLKVWNITLSRIVRSMQAFIMQPRFLFHITDFSFCAQLATCSQGLGAHAARSVWNRTSTTLTTTTPPTTTTTTISSSYSSSWVTIDHDIRSSSQSVKYACSPRTLGGSSLYHDCVSRFCANCAETVATMANCCQIWYICATCLLLAQSWSEQYFYRIFLNFNIFSFFYIPLLREHLYCRFSVCISIRLFRKK